MDYIKKNMPKEIAKCMFFFIFLLIQSYFKKFLTLKSNIILIKKSQYMIFLYKFYKLLSLHQQKFNYTSFETFLSLCEMKMNLCCKKPEPFGNLHVRKTFLTGAVWKLIFL